ncbi:fructose PTS transporter subunit IIA [Alkalibacterium putridalgicola]|uniref:PTS system, fructose-specific IIA component n=1 Tax=Alkalibacterium putridalgicola TaxID=426703 RepID=A0A1H7RSR7_9LACT|nr:fructose PTS transporter subunit IIA [Alkalibacterium putridalgicola]GEK88959.1 hypothetical protein APU01nite_09980 [Alkalibacterium putridalgicola]SEL63049.1 PTS system, fructose-specific IIA component [Alkalibacterium putridalgicola]
MNESADGGVDYYIDPSKTFQSGKKTEIFKEILDDVKSHSAFDFEREEVLQEIKKREALSTTGFGNGFAIPHGKSSQIHTPIVVLMKTDQKLEWEALDGQPVSIIFLLIVPKEKGEAIHLKLLSRLSYHLMDKKIQEAFKNAETKEDCEALLNQLLV